MIKVALIKSNGEVAYTVSPAVDDMYVDGQTYNDCIAKHIDHTANDAVVISTWYWDDKWKTREAKSDDWHDWVDNAWCFNSIDFWDFVRGQRNGLIIDSDWTQVTDSPLSSAKKTEWARYRQALRDAPETYSYATSLDAIIWPTKPR
jgi:hypothetical protein